jgi:pimeloyl-ACP methyl ester carboxylesterase
LVGLSWGGGVTHRLLARHPELVDRAAIDCAGVLTVRGGSILLLGIAVVSPFLHARPVVALFSRIIGMDEAGRDDLRRASPRAFRRAFVEGFKGGVSRVEMSAPSPTLLTAGETERAIRPSNAAQATLMPHAEARFAPGLGHGWLARRTELHVRMVEAWLTGGELPAELEPERAWPSALERMRRELEKESTDAHHRLAV